LEHDSLGRGLLGNLEHPDIAKSPFGSATAREGGDSRNALTVSDEAHAR
jgi:hypothetical protein